MTNKLISKIGVGVASILVVLFGIFLFQETHLAFASAPSGLPATVATTSSIAVGTSTLSTTLFVPSTCSARIITTVAQPIMLSFSAISSTTITQTVGHLQGASTTVAYDSGIYGCGRVNAVGITYSASLASSTIFLTETQ